MAGNVVVGLMRLGKFLGALETLKHRPCPAHRLDLTSPEHHKSGPSKVVVRPEVFNTSIARSSAF
jgi:hypothetical protein